MLFRSFVFIAVKILRQYVACAIKLFTIVINTNNVVSLIVLYSASSTLVRYHLTKLQHLTALLSKDWLPASSINTRLGWK
jgi:hypothetical protein